MALLKPKLTPDEEAVTSKARLLKARIERLKRDGHDVTHAVVARALGIDRGHFTAIVNGQFPTERAERYIDEANRLLDEALAGEPA